MSFLKESQGHLGNLTDKSRIELIDILDRQKKLLQNKKFVSSLKDGGQKIQEFVTELKRILSEKDELEDAVAQFEGMSLQGNSMEVDPPGNIASDAEKKEVRTIEKIQEVKRKKGPMASQQKKEPFKPFSTLRSDVKKLPDKPKTVETKIPDQKNQMVTIETESLSDILGRVTDEKFLEFESNVSPFTSSTAREFVTFSPEKEFKLISFDIKTSSSGIDAEICQISAVSAEGDTFSEYCLPAYMSKTATKVTGITVEYQDGKRILRKSGQTLEAHSRQVVLTRFVDYLQKQNTNENSVVIVTTNTAYQQTLLYNLKTFSIPVPEICFANIMPLFSSLQSNGKIRVDKCDLESVFYSLYDYKLDMSDSQVVSQAIHKVLNESRLGITMEDKVNSIECVSSDFAQTDLDFVLAKRQRLNSLRGKLFDSTVLSHNVITPDIAEKIAAAGINYSHLERLFDLGTDAFFSVLAKPPSNCAGWGPRVTDDTNLLQKIQNHFVKRKRQTQRYEGVLTGGFVTSGKSHSAKLVSLDESMNLQKLQKTKLEELQARQASARLASTSHIKMQPFDPEASKVLASYREPVGEAAIESDSDEDAQEMDYPD